MTIQEAIKSGKPFTVSEWKKHKQWLGINKNEIVYAGWSRQYIDSSDILATDWEVLICEKHETIVNDYLESGYPCNTCIGNEDKSQAPSNNDSEWHTLEELEREHGLPLFIQFKNESTVYKVIKEEGQYYTKMEACERVLRASVARLWKLAPVNPAPTKKEEYRSLKEIDEEVGLPFKVEHSDGEIVKFIKQNNFMYVPCEPTGISRNCGSRVWKLVDACDEEKCLKSGLLSKPFTGNQPMISNKDKACDCGAESIGGGSHSDWCSARRG